MARRLELLRAPARSWAGVLRKWAASVREHKARQAIKIGVAVLAAAIGDGDAQRHANSLIDGHTFFERGVDCIRYGICKNRWQFPLNRYQFAHGVAFSIGGSGAFTRLRCAPCPPSRLPACRFCRADPRDRACALSE